MTKYCDEESVATESNHGTADALKQRSLIRIDQFILNIDSLMYRPTYKLSVKLI